MTKVVVNLGSTRGLDSAVPALRRDYPQVAFVACSDRDELAHAIEDAEVYLGSITRREVLAARNLKWVQAASTGVDHMLAIPELAESDILLSGARGTHSAAVAESAMSMLLAFTRGIRESTLLQGQHKWAQAAVRLHMVELTGSTLGLVGFGALAQALARRAHAFDMRVVAVDPYAPASPDYVELWRLDRLDDLLKQSDYVVICAPGGPRTKNMISAREIGLMRPRALLVAISRGGVVNQQALAEALREKRLAAAALDVFETEPLPADSELWDMENVLVTSHIAGGTQYEVERIIAIFRDNLDRFLRGELPLRNQVDKARGF
jgi:phosphoglycerate dehydrogenase-like enzyme